MIHNTFNSKRSHRGFTVIELVMVIVILGILSATALPKFFDLAIYRNRAFFDDTLAAIRYAQKLAVATDCNVQFKISSNQYQLKRPAATDRSQCSSTTTADFTLDVSRPGTGSSVYQGSQAGISLSPLTLFFTGKGLASSDAALTIGNRSIDVVAATGFVYDSTP